MIDRRMAALLAVALVASLLAGCGSPQAHRNKDERPNILFIMADDHAERAISAYGSSLIETPNIDRIAKGGVLFTNSFVANSICGPSRATMLTGKHSHVNGFRNNYDRFDATQPTFPQYLQDAGYETAVVGKWHLKSDPVGFDYWEVLRGQGFYYSPDFVTNSPSHLTRKVPVTDDEGKVVGEEMENHYAGAYATTKIGDLAIDFLERRDASRPFLLVFNHKAPHRNWMPDVDELGQVDTSSVPLPESFDDTYAGRPAAAAQEMEIGDLYLSYDLKLEAHDYEGDLDDVADGWPERWGLFYDRMSAEQKRKWDAYYGAANREYQAVKHDPRALLTWKFRRYLHDYLGSVLSMDRSIGRVLDYLDEHGLADNTLVVYTSDQGFYLGEHRWFDKRFMYEESMRTPLAMRLPGVIEAGRQETEKVQNIDYAPTLLDFAAIAAPRDMQGLSLKPLLTGRTASLERGALYYRYYEGIETEHHVSRHYGVRTDTHKLIHFLDAGMDHWELYDLVRDPHEMQNVYDDPTYGRVQAAMHDTLEAVRERYGDFSVRE